MITPAVSSDPHVQLDPSEFFWALLDEDAARAAVRSSGAGRRATALGHLFDETLPVPIENVHAVYARTSSGAYIACGLSNETVSQHLDTGTLTLSPSCLPDWLDAEIDLGSLNLLIPPYEPATARRKRRRWNIHTAVLLLALLAMVVAGFELRRAQWLSGIDTVTAAEQALYDQVLPAGQSNQPDALRLTAELRRLRQTRMAPGDTLLPPRADDRLAIMLASWPQSIDARAELVTVTPESITCQVIVPDADAAASLAGALGELPGWRSRQPQIRTQRDAVRTTIRLEPVDTLKDGEP